jgi:para-aminobenzoate synthetase component 1
MKGTAPRHEDPAEDERLGRELLQSEKNRAENLMIVDLLRNDLGRIAVPGTVSVDALFSLERYPSVWTLTSTIRAQAPEVGLETLLRALFPCGSITGAPKIAAMKKIKELEGRTRGIYCGSIGWLAPGGDCSLNVAIRTIEMHDEQDGVFGVGGGIVYDSVPEQEWEECLWKARILAPPQAKAQRNDG